MEIHGLSIVFYGHKVFPLGLCTDVSLAFTSFVYLKLYLNAQRLRNKGGMYFWGYVWLMHLPNSVYLFMEFRHILLQDGVADAWEPTAVIVFGILSLLGLVLSIIQIYLTVTKVNVLRNNQVLATILLSFIATWGSVLGIHDLVSIMGILFPPLLITFTIESLTLEWVIVELVVGILISVLSLLALKILQIKRNPQNEMRVFT